MFKRRKKYYILLICLSILGSSVTAPFFNSASAQEVTDSLETSDSEQETIVAETKTEDIEIVETESESVETETIETETVEETEAALDLEAIEEGDLANSWRYTDGVRNSSGTLSRSTTVSNAWSNVNGYFINSFGGIISGALAKGIDVSVHQGTINWTSVEASDVEYAIIRCGYGQNYTSQDDSKWKTNADACTKLGIPFGTYLYSYADTTAKAKSEAEHVLRLVAGYNLDYPIYYDMEDDGVIAALEEEGLTSAQIKTRLAQIAQTFCSTIEAAGYEVQIYANKYWFTTYLTDSNFNQWDKWIAQYNYQCDYTGSYSMWQATSSGSVSGISGNVDLNFLFEYPTSYGVNTEKIEAFVTRLYQKVLGRNPDAGGFNNWVNSLALGKKTAADVAYGFVMSAESLGKNRTNKEFVTMLYNSFLDRAPDTIGLNSWVDALESGVSYKYVLKGVIHSSEFKSLCTKYGITQGSITLTESRDKNINVTKCVNRFYQKILGRSADVAGLNNWTANINGNKITMAKAAYGFVFSTEFKNKNYTNEQFVTLLYQGLFGREPDSVGKNYWINKLNSGISRTTVFDGFANSQEFKKMLSSMGVN